MAFALDLSPMRLPWLRDDKLRLSYPITRRLLRSNPPEDVFDLIEEAHRRYKRAHPEESTKFEVKMDVKGYKPSELSVKVEEDFLIVSGKHEVESEDGCQFISRQFTRKHRLPEDVDLDAIKSSLATDGHVLRIVAPMKTKAIEAPENDIPIKVMRCEGKNMQAADSPCAA